MLETIKSYLVSLGWEIDRASYDKATKSIDDFGKQVEVFAEKVIGTAAKAGAALASVGVAAAVGMAKFFDGLGNQEIQMEMLSRQLWTTQQQAQEFSATMKALGANLQDLYLSPTLMSQYQQLHGVAAELQGQTPGDYNKQIEQVQALQFQFKELKLIGYYSLQSIGYWAIKYLSGPFGKAQNILQSINNWLIKNMPTWTKHVGEFMAAFVQAGIHIGEAIGTVWDWLHKVSDYLPTWVKTVGAAFAVFELSNPFMRWIEGITAFLLLLDDFEAYQHGEKSAFPQLWKSLDQVNAQFNKMGGSKGALTELGNSFSYLGSGIQSVVAGLNQLFGTMNNSKNQSGLNSFFQTIYNLGSVSMAIFNGLLVELGSVAKIIGDLLQGHLWQAVKDFDNIITTQNLADAWGPKGKGKSSGVAPSVKVGTGSYLYPRAYTTTHNNTKTSTVHAPVTVNQHIHGSGDPHATATAVNKNVGGFLGRYLHNLQGPIG